MKRKQKRGFTVAELVIAMAVILIVTATALTVVFTSRTAGARALCRADAVRFSENVWECFKASDNTTEFLDAIKFAEGETPAYDEATGIYTWTSPRHGYTATVKLDYDVPRPTLSVFVVEDGDELLSFEYEKGGTAS